MVNLPRLSVFQLENRVALQAMMDELMTQVEEQVADLTAAIADIAAAQAAADAAQVDADDALTQLTNISSDGVLDRSEKAQLVLIVQQIIDEKSGINTRATDLGITTENTTYNTEYTDLINYLNGLSPAYTNTSQNTTIVRATFDNNFEAFYSARQALFNKMDDVASAQSVIIDPIADVVIYAESDGTIKTGELPRNVALTASKGNASVTTSGTWSRTVTTGITCTIGASTGVLAITAFTVQEVEVPVSFVYSGVTRTARVHVIRKDDPPTTPGGGGGGSGGTTANTTTMGSTTGTAYDTTNAVSATLTVTASSAGKVRCDAPPSFKRTPGTSDGETGTLGKWQWRVPAGTWADIATEVADTTDSATETTDIQRTSWGSIDVTHTKTGLTGGSDYEFRFLWRRVDVSGTAENVYASGTLSADGTVA